MRHPLILLPVLLAAPLSARINNQRTVAAGEFVDEPPTLVSLGFEWRIAGDVAQGVTSDAGCSGRYTAANMFAGSIVTVRTRKEPQPAVGGHRYRVYPVDWQGPKQEPAFTGLMAAYYMGLASCI